MDTYWDEVLSGGRSMPSFGLIATRHQSVKQYYTVFTLRGPKQDVRSLTLNQFDIVVSTCHLAQLGFLGLEPIGNNQFPTWPQYSGGVAEEQSLVREMAESLGDPDSVKGGRGEMGFHGFGIELHIFDTAAEGAQLVEGRSVEIVETVNIGTSTSTPTAAATALLFEGDAVGDGDLAATDGDASDGAAEFSGEVAGRTPNTTTDIEHGAVGRKLGNGQQQIDQIHLAGFFGVAVGLEIGMVDVLAPVGDGPPDRLVFSQVSMMMMMMNRTKDSRTRSNPRRREGIHESDLPQGVVIVAGQLIVMPDPPFQRCERRVFFVRWHFILVAGMLLAVDCGRGVRSCVCRRVSHDSTVIR